MPPNFEICLVATAKPVFLMQSLLGELLTVITQGQKPCVLELPT